MISSFKVVIDTSTIITGIFSEKFFKLINFAFNKKLQIFTSFPIIEELANVLEKDKFIDIPIEKKERLFKEFIKYVKIISPKQKITICRDPHDNKILECALEAKVRCIISEDSDLKVLKKFKNIKIYSLKKFFKKYKF